MAPVRVLLTILLLALPRLAGAESLVSSLSDAAIEITSSFTGSRIVVFGVVRDEQETDDSWGYEVAVVVHGPDTEITARRKDRIFGLWVNAASQDFFKVPSYYVVHMSENFSLAASEELVAQYKLGLENLNFVRSAYSPEARKFADAVIDIRKREGLFVERPDAITFLAPNVFRTTFFLPAVVPVGTYRVSVFLFREEKLLAARTENLEISKTGLSDSIASFARAQGTLYGIVTVGLALFIGWFAGVIFRRS
ncbi:MAG TPA: TIGR02186 family protein [Afifellaceae bacterium]|nr:TIGR02186 family protein [Afifellaceae bacterium]